MPFPSSWLARTFQPGGPLLGALASLLFLVLWGDSSQLAWLDLATQQRQTNAQPASPWVVTVVLDAKDANPEAQSALLEGLHSVGVRTVLWTTVYSRSPVAAFARPLPDFPGGVFFPTPLAGNQPPFVVRPDRDGRIRSVKPLAMGPGGAVPSAPLRALMGYLGVDGDLVTTPIGLLLRQARFPGEPSKDWLLPMDPQGKVWLGFSGPLWTQVRFYHSSVIQGIPLHSEDWVNLASELRNTLVVVTEPDAELSLGQTPLEQDLPLVELNRIFLGDSLSGQLLRPPFPPFWATAVGVAFVSLLCSVGGFWYRWSVVVTVGGGALLLWLMGAVAGWVLDPSPWLVWGGFVGGALLDSHIRGRWREARVWIQLGKQTSLLFHNLKGLTSLVLQINRQIRRPSAPEAIERWTQLQESGLKTMQDLLSGTSGFLQGEHWHVGDPVQLKPLLQGLWNLYQSGYPHLGTLELPVEDVVSTVSPSDFLQVVDNLIKNAIESVSADRKPCLKLSLTTQESGFCLRLEDNGVGFSPSLIRFGQTTKRGGTGTGLVYVNKTVAQWGAQWRIDGAPGGGTLVTISGLPTWKPLVPP